MYKLIRGIFVATLVMFAVMLPYSGNAMVQSGYQSDTNLKMEYPLVYLTNVNAQNKINTDIASYVEQLKALYYNGKCFSANMKYEIKYEDDQYLSLTITSYSYNKGAAHGQYKTAGLVYDKASGNRVPLENFVPIQSADEINMAINAYVVKAFDEKGRRIFLHHGFRARRISSDYYLGGKGIVYVLYQPYELASFANGVTHVEFTPEAIEYFKRKMNG